jgi:hypothetical protein
MSILKGMLRVEGYVIHLEFIALCCDSYLLTLLSKRAN